MLSGSETVYTSSVERQLNFFFLLVFFIFLVWHKLVYPRNYLHKSSHTFYLCIHQTFHV